MQGMGRRPTLTLYADKENQHITSSAHAKHVLSCILSAVEGLSKGRTRLCWRIGQGSPHGPKTPRQSTNSWRSWRLCVRFVVC